MPSDPRNADKFARVLIAKHEGVRKHPYLCPADKITIGIGRNLEDVGLSADEVSYLFANDLRNARQACRHLFREFHSIDEVRQAVLLDMAFNLGQTRLAKFVRMREAIDLMDWRRARAEMLDSKWAEQVPTRAEFLADMMCSGRWPRELKAPRLV